MSWRDSARAVYFWAAVTWLLQCALVFVLVVGAAVFLVSGWRYIRVDGQVSLPTNMGSHANLWNAAAVGAGGNSAVFDSRGYPNCTLFGNSSVASNTITLQVSADGTNFYSGEVSTLAGAGGDFGTFIVIGARYVRLQAAMAATITATAQCKGH